jgi:hypothetical protein
VTDSMKQRMVFGLVGILVGAVLTTMFTRPITTGVDLLRWRSSPGDHPATPTCQDPGWLREVKPITANAYLVLHPDKDERDRFPIPPVAAYTIDGSSLTPWVAPYPADDPDNNWIAWRFQGSPRITLMCLQNGDISTYGAYKTNGRLKTATLTGCPDESNTIEFADMIDLHKNVYREDDDHNHDDFQGISLDCRTHELRLTISEAYPVSDGMPISTLKSTDKVNVAISEVKFYEGFGLI